MSLVELEDWRDFYRLYPFDDHHRIYRPAALISASMSGEVKAKLDWLAPEPLPTGYSQAELNSFAAYGIAPPKRD